MRRNGLRTCHKEIGYKKDKEWLVFLYRSNNRTKQKTERKDEMGGVTTLISLGFPCHLEIRGSPWLTLAGQACAGSQALIRSTVCCRDSYGEEIKRWSQT